MSIELILFDLDGTLLNSGKDLHACTNQLLARYNKPPLDLELIEKNINRGSMGFIELGFGKHLTQKTKKQLQEEFFNLYQDFLLHEKVHFFEGTHELIKNLYQANFRLGIVTNKITRFTMPLIEHSGLAHCFDAIVCADQVKHPKPAADGLLKACTDLSLDPIHACYVGDTRFDMDAASAARMPGLLALWGYWPYLKYDISSWPVTKLFHKPEELFEWLLALQ